MGIDDSDKRRASPRVGLLVSHIRQEEKMILQAAERRGIEMQLLRDRDLVLDLTGPNLPQVDVVLDRCIAHARGGCALQVFDRWDIPTVNSSRATMLCDDKAVMSATLVAHDIPMVRTAVAFSVTGALEIGERFGYPLVVKPVAGSWGRLMARANTPEALQTILNQKDKLGSLHHGIFYLQEYVEKPGRDIRVIVIGTEVIAATYRNADHWITNVARGAVSSACPISKEIASLTLAAANALEVEIAGVDLIETLDGLKVIEVNSGVEFKGLDATTDMPVADLIVEYVLGKGLGIRE